VCLCLGGGGGWCGGGWGGVGGAGATPSLPSSPLPPTIWFGSPQITFWKLLADELKSPPPWLRLVPKRGTWFAPLDPRRPPSTSLPRLLRLMDMSVGMTSFVVEHGVPAAPGGSLVPAPAVGAACALAIDAARYRGRMRLNVPAARDLPATASSIARKRESSRTDSVTLETAVLATGLALAAGGRRAAAGEPQGAGAPPPGAPALTVNELEVDVGKDLAEGVDAGSDGRAAAAAPRRPTRVVFHGARVLAGGDERDAVVDAVADIVAGFRAPCRAQRAPADPGCAAAVVDAAPPAPASPPPASPPPLSPSPPPQRPGATPDGGDLLKLLLAQGAGEGEREGEGASASADADAPARPLSASVRARLASPPPGGRPRAGVTGATSVPAPAAPPRYEIVADGIQLCLCAETAPGRLLITAATARLVGGPPRGDPDRTALSFEAGGVAAHAALNDVDPRGPPPWLDATGAPPSTIAAGAAPELVVEPFALTVRRAGAAPAVGDGARARPARADELAVDLPSLAARASGAQFAVLVDVGQTLGGRLPPARPSPAVAAVELARAVAAPAATTADDRAVKRAAARYGRAAAELACLRGDVAAAAPRAARGGSDGGWSAAPPTRAADAAAAIRDALAVGGGPLAAGAARAGVGAGAPPRPPASADDAAAPRALALWAAAAAAARAAERGAAAAELAAARAAAAAAAPAAHARHTRASLARLALALAEPDGAPFLDLTLDGAVLAAESNPDGSGASKLVLASASVRDPAARLGPAPGTDAGGVLVLWHPDASWEGDPALRVLARAAPCATGYAAVYEHVEASIHPLAAHLSDALAAGLWEFFFPPAVGDAGDGGDAKLTRRQEAFVRRAVAPAKGLFARHKDRGGALSPSASGGALAGGGSGVPSPGVLSDEDEVPPDDASGVSLVRASRRARPAPPPPARRPPRRVLFERVRLNRVHVRVSYEGAPVSFSDLRLVLDGRTYERVDGGWAALAARVKWDTVKSVLKSVAGLQGRKFRELLPGGGEEAGGAGERGADGARAGLAAALARRSHAAAGEGGSGMDDVAVAIAAAAAAAAVAAADDDAKRRLLLGDAAAAAPRPSPCKRPPAAERGMSSEDELPASVGARSIVSERGGGPPALPPVDLPPPPPRPPRAPAPVDYGPLGHARVSSGTESAASGALSPAASGAVPARVSAEFGSLAPRRSVEAATSSTGLHPLGTAVAGGCAPTVAAAAEAAARPPPPSRLSLAALLTRRSASSGGSSAPNTPTAAAFAAVAAGELGVRPRVEAAVAADDGATTATAAPTSPLSDATASPTTRKQRLAAALDRARAGTAERAARLAAGAERAGGALADRARAAARAAKEKAGRRGGGG